MKIRNDFVTNSSSSSFIIARHKDCSYKEIKDSVNRQQEKIRGYIDEEIDYINPENEEIVIEYLSGNKEKAVELAVEEIADSLYNFVSTTSMELGGWNVNAEEMRSEDDTFFHVIMFDFGYLFASEHLKVS